MCSLFWRALGMKRETQTSHEALKASCDPLKVTESKLPKLLEMTSQRSRSDSCSASVKI